MIGWVGGLVEGGRDCCGDSGGGDGDGGESALDWQIFSCLFLFLSFLNCQIFSCLFLFLTFEKTTKQCLHSITDCVCLILSSSLCKIDAHVFECFFYILVWSHTQFGHK